ncbi:MAG: copper ABC transporter ATP-binding protein [Bacteroidetes bacterium HGW-Bacteroidetes-13]|jgi:Cu-processing system ATP-binding protein|nr:MAG: copper ABC transporter ATP-binding protein [Bacteroidetes bacterium HGW-Bacteroidetes-13]
MIEFKNITKKFGKLQVLEQVDLSINKPGIYAILGPNGSGKTTLIKCLLGMTIPTSGQIFVDGQDTKGKWEFRNQISYLPQIANFPKNMTVTELLRLIKTLRKQASAEQPLIDVFGLKPYLNKNMGTLSGGTKQKVNLVLALMTDNPIVILDEPTSGLDPLALLELKKLIKIEKEKGKTILITSHIMSLVEELSDEIVFLLEGKIHFRGTVDALKTKTQTVDFDEAIAQILKPSHV